MADMTHQGPQTHQRQDAGRQETSTGASLSGLSVAPSFMEAELTRLPVHTGETVASKWGLRSFDTGVVIEGKRLGRQS